MSRRWSKTSQIPSVTSSALSVNVEATRRIRSSAWRDSRSCWSPRWRARVPAGEVGRDDGGALRFLVGRAFTVEEEADGSDPHVPRRAGGQQSRPRSRRERSRHCRGTTPTASSGPGRAHRTGLAASVTVMVCCRSRRPPGCRWSGEAGWVDDDELLALDEPECRTLSLPPSRRCPRGTACATSDDETAPDRPAVSRCSASRFDDAWAKSTAVAACSRLSHDDAHPHHAERDDQRRAPSEVAFVAFVDSSGSPRGRSSPPSRSRRRPGPERRPPYRA